MKINSGTFLSYLQLKESNEFGTALNEKTPKKYSLKNRKIKNKTDTSFFEVSEDKNTCTLNTQLTSADLSNREIFEISNGTASFKYKTDRGNSSSPPPFSSGGLY